MIELGQGCDRGRVVISTDDVSSSQVDVLLVKRSGALLKVVGLRKNLQSDAL